MALVLLTSCLFSHKKSYCLMISGFLTKATHKFCMCEYLHLHVKNISLILLLRKVIITMAFFDKILPNLFSTSCMRTTKYEMLHKVTNH